MLFAPLTVDGPGLLVRHRPAIPQHLERQTPSEPGRQERGQEARWEHWDGDLARKNKKRRGEERKREEVRSSGVFICIPLTVRGERVIDLLRENIGPGR